METVKSPVKRSFSEFYAYYLGEHRHPVCKLLHFLGTLALMAMMIWMTAAHQWSKFYILPIVVYGFAWSGHFFFEKNRPATFHSPIYSLIADFRMFFEIATGRRSLK